jgi:hypothetical protein
LKGCPAVPAKACRLYTPGFYTNGLEIKNTTAVFSPGVYYMDGAKGFSNAANGEMYMCTDSAGVCQADTSAGGTQNIGMLVYLSKNASTISVGANASAQLVGSSASSNYKGILFFVDRTSPLRSHSLGGGGALSLQGTIYATNAAWTQAITLQGHSGSATTIKGDIITDVLGMGGSSGITMQLDKNYVLPVNQVALVN